MGKPSGLTRRNGSGSWYFRQRWPDRFKRPDTPAEVWISLGTASYPEALSALENARLEALRRFTQEAPPAPRTGIYSRSPQPQWPTDPSLPLLAVTDAGPLARAYFRQALLGCDVEPPMPADWSSAKTDAYRLELLDRRHRLMRPGDDDERDDVEYPMIGVLTGAGLRCDLRSEAGILLQNYLRRAMAQIIAIQLARLNGDFRDRITDRLFAKMGEENALSRSVSVASPILSGTKLDTDLVDRWARERKVSPKGVDKHRAAARWFRERTGVVVVEEVTRRDVLTFKDKMIEEGVSAANANAKLSCLRTLLSYAAQNGLTDRNEATGIRVLDKDKERRKRKAFELVSLNAIFASPIYSADKRPVQGRKEAAYWLPLMALLTGARLEELAQLRTTDVRQETYLDGDDHERTTWMIHIVQEEELSTKNAGSDRRVPVHPDLETLGFVRMVQQAAEEGERFLFPDLRPNIYGSRGAKWGEWWSRYRREVCGVTDPRQVFHSFRHCFKFYARHVGMIEGVQRQIMGHKPGDVAAEYGGGRYTVHQLVEGMKLFRIPGLRLPLPPPAQRG